MPRRACSAGEVAVLVPVTNAIVGRRMHNQRPGPWPAAGGAPRSHLVLSWGRRGGWDCLRRCAEASPPGRTRPRTRRPRPWCCCVRRAGHGPGRRRSIRAATPARSLPGCCKQGLPGEAGAETIAQKPVQCADAQRPHGHPPDLCWWERILQHRRVRPVGRAPSEQHQNTACRESAQGEGKGGRGGRIEPLHVIDCEHDRLVLAEPLEHIANSEPHGTAVDRSSRGIVSKHRDPERAPARRRQSRQHLIEDVIEKVSEPDVDEGLLGLGRTRRDNPDPPGAGEAHALEPERRLADSRFTLKDHRRRSVRHTAEERGHTGALLVPYRKSPAPTCSGPSRTSHRPHTTPYSSRGVVRYQATTSYRDFA